MGHRYTALSRSTPQGLCLPNGHNGDDTGDDGSPIVPAKRICVGEEEDTAKRRDEDKNRCQCRSQIRPRTSRCIATTWKAGAKAAVRFVHEQLAANTFVFRTDVKSYYASMDHDLLLAMLERHVPDGRVLDLLRHYVRRTIYDGGLYEDVERGISLGCPLSPLMGALYLKLLDERVEATGLAYARFMDDWVILAPTRWKLREAIRLVNQTLAELHVEQHPDKTFIGRISRGFDFLGYAFTPAGLEVAPQAVERCVERVSRLYEQGVDLLHIGTYVRRWLRWARSGLGTLGAGLSERALELVVRSLGRLGLLGGCLPTLLPAFANQNAGDDTAYPECR